MVAYEQDVPMQRKVHGIGICLVNASADWQSIGMASTTARQWQQ